MRCGQGPNTPFRRRKARTASPKGGVEQRDLSGGPSPVGGEEDRYDLLLLLDILLYCEE